MPKQESTVASVVKTEIDLKDRKYYLNRELSMLAFQERVLEEAEDSSNPLLDRVKFLAIVGSNLDEFFMVRVAGLRKQIESGAYGMPVAVSDDGMTPQEQLAAVRKVSLRLMNRARKCWHDQIFPALAKEGIHVLDYEHLSKAQKAQLKDYFDNVIFPVATPLAFDPGHPFPHISNLSLNLAVTVRDPSGKDHFARVKVPTSILPRLVPLKRSSGATRKDGTNPEGHYFTWLEQVIAANLDAFFPGMRVIDAHPFRVTRDADLEIQELEASDLLETMEQSVRQRRFGSVVRLTINNQMPEAIRNLLMENLELDRNDIYPIDGNTGLSDLMTIYQIDRKDLKEKPFVPAVPPVFQSPDSLQQGDSPEPINIFDLIRSGDRLLHHPYDSFHPVIDFLRSAARDPNVLAIKQTLYRVGRRPPVVEALLEAVRNGKQVAVLLELKARFDEESNIGWARMLEKEGVHVIYGLLGLKTHSKVALVVRKEGDGIRRYMHLATGNYNAVTAQLYEDLGMFTCDEQIGADTTDLFNYLTGYSRKEEYRKLLVAPVNMRSRFEALIDREILHQQQAGNGQLIFKINSLIDAKMIHHLYLASQAGVKINLIVRGICGLRPGIKGVSENITVTSIVGRFLEHSRVYYFNNNGAPEIYLGSADLMPRNIDRRVEVLFPVQHPSLIHHIKENILEIYLRDNIKARIMQPDGSYTRARLGSGDLPLNAQEWYLQQRQIA
jgi:polyphosphate kinase